jgi:hypothetical protein
VAYFEVSAQTARLLWGAAEAITARRLPQVHLGQRRYRILAVPAGESDRISVVGRRHDIYQAKAQSGVSLCAR